MESIVKTMMQQLLSKELCSDFSRSKLQLPLLIPSPGAKCVWNKPDTGWLKLNCDASFVEDANSRCGFIIRDSCVSVVLLGLCGIGVVPGIEYAEAVAIREGIQGAIDHGLNRLVVEYDCLSLISKLRLCRFWKGPLGQQLEAIRRLGARVGEIRWSHVKRDGNKVAHALARLGFSQVVVNSSMLLFPGVIEQTRVVI